MTIARELFVRILAGAAVLWAAASLAFVVLQMLPSDPVQVIYGADATVTQEMRDRIRTEYGLDLPIWEQYGQFVGRILQGDLGTSYQQRRSVVSIITSELGSTVTLAVLATIFALTLATIASVTTAGKQSRARSIELNIANLRLYVEEQEQRVKDWKLRDLIPR